MAKSYLRRNRHSPTRQLGGALWRFFKSLDNVALAAVTLLSELFSGVLEPLVASNIPSLAPGEYGTLAVARTLIAVAGWGLLAATRLMQNLPLVGEDGALYVVFFLSSYLSGIAAQWLEVVAGIPYFMGILGITIAVSFFYGWREGQRPPS